MILSFLPGEIKGGIFMSENKIVFCQLPEGVSMVCIKATGLVLINEIYKAEEECN